MTTTADIRAAHTTDTGPSVWERRLLLGATVLAVTAVAGIAGAISYGHMHDWASANGEPSWRALLFPLSVDGLLIAASVVLLADSRAGRTADWLAYLLAGTGASVSVAVNVAHDWTDPVAATAIAGWPPVALLGSYELLMRLLRRLRPMSGSAALTSAPAESGVDSPSGAPVVPQKRRAPSAPTTRGSGQSRRPGRTADTGRSFGRTGSVAHDKGLAWWIAERSAGREPSGAEVARVAGVDASLGRRWVRKWLSGPAVTADAPETTTEADSDKTEMTGTTGESRNEIDPTTETSEEAA